MKRFMKNKKTFFILAFFVLSLAFGCGYSLGKESVTEKIVKEELCECEKVININTATYDELVSLDGIGDKTAKEIMDYIRECGGFNELRDLVVLGYISEKTAEAIKDKVVVIIP